MRPLSSNRAVAHDARSQRGIWCHRTSASACFFGNDRSSRSRVRTRLITKYVYYEWATDSFAYPCPCNNSRYARAYTRAGRCSLEKGKGGGAWRYAWAYNVAFVKEYLNSRWSKSASKEICLTSIANWSNTSLFQGFRSWEQCKEMWAEKKNKQQEWQQLRLGEIWTFQRKMRRPYDWWRTAE